MKFPDHGVRFPIELDTRHCTPSPAELEKMRTNLEPLLRAVDHFPVVSLHIVLECFQRTTTHRAKVSLALTGKTLVSVEEHTHLHAAFECCLKNLLQDVSAYKARMENETEFQKEEKGTHHPLRPDLDPDSATLEAAVLSTDYTAFRLALFGYDEPVRKRIGRWIERYPEVEARIGKGLEIDDLVEEVFLDAFEQYSARPKELRLGEWLERLIDPAVKEIVFDRNGELENVRFARTAREAETGERPRRQKKSDRVDG
jgi:ribosome-associated translation inhibitor RaiA